jgi:hypothetical protein
MMKLNEDQQRYADMVAAEARRQGVNPQLAISVAFAESGLNPSTPPSSKGAIGLMQLMPGTAEELGVDPNIPLQNIRGGVTYLRQLGERFENDPVKVLSAYNQGPNSAFFKTNDLKDLSTETLKYVVKIADIHGGNIPQVIASVEDKVEDKVEDERPPIDLNAIKQARDMFSQASQTVIGAGSGAAAGLTVGAPLQTARILGSAFRGNIPGAAPSAAPSPAPTAPQARPGPVRPPLGGTGTQNYAKAFGLGDIEAGRAADMTKQAGGVHDLTTKRAAGLQKINELFPNQFREDPRFGGLMTPQERPGPGPRGPAGRVGGGKSPPLVKPPGPLKQITSMFQDMASGYPKAARGVANIAQKAPIISYPLAGANIGGNLASLAGDLQQDNPDYYGAALKGLGALGTGLSMFPLTAPYGIPLATIPPLIQYYRDNPSTVEPEIISP